MGEETAPTPVCRPRSGGSPSGRPHWPEWTRPGIGRWTSGLYSAGMAPSPSQPPQTDRGTHARLRGLGGGPSPVMISPGLGRGRCHGEATRSRLPFSPISAHQPHASARRPSPRIHRRPGPLLQMISSAQAAGDALPWAPSWTGRWFLPKGDRSFRVWACSDHLEGLTGLRQFGGLT